MPCWERTTISEVQLPENMNRKFLIEGLTALKYTMENGMNDSLEIYKDGTRVGNFARNGKLTVESRSRARNDQLGKELKQAYSTGMAIVSARKRGLQVSKVETISQKGGRQTVRITAEGSRGNY